MTADVKNIFSSDTGRVPGWNRVQQTLDQMAARVRAQAEAAVSGLPISRLSRHPRDAMQVTTKAWNLNGDPGIYLFANPTDMRWSMPRRGTVVKTTAGAVRNVWRNRYRNTYYDEGTIGITFQTGNIMPAMGYPSDLDLKTVDQIAAARQNPQVPEGLMNFYRFMELLDQPMLLGTFENRHVIRHHSRAFPNMYIEGYFLEDSFNFSEMATDGNRLQWEATFQVYRTVPRMNNARRLAAKYQAWVKASGQLEQLGAENIEKSKVAQAFGASIPDPSPLAPTTISTLSDKQKTLVDTAVKDVQSNSALVGLLQG